MPRQIALMTADGQHYVCAEDGGASPLVANRLAIGAWETFTIDVLDGTSIALQAVNGLWVCAEDGGGRELIANRSAVATWETFTVVDMAGGFIALRTASGHFVCAEGGGGGAIVADRDAPGPWESFRMVMVGVAEPPPSPEPEPEPRPDPPPDIGGGGRLLQVTTAGDGPLHPRFYSYWPNAYVRDGAAYVFAGHMDGRPRFFRVNLGNGSVERVGMAVGYGGTTEGWYWDAAGRITLIDGPRLRRVDPFTGGDEVLFDIEGSHPGCRLWQPHSSEDGRTHSATVERIVSEGAYPRIGTVVWRRGRQEFFPAQGALDESALADPFLIIQESHNNRVINLDTRETRILLDGDGAVAHCDCGPGFVVGECDKPDPGCCALWDLRQPLTVDRRRVLFTTLNMGHVSVRGGRCLLSNNTSLGLVDMERGGVRWLLDHGGGGGGYDEQVRANLDPSGRVACFMARGAVKLLVL